MSSNIYEDGTYAAKNQTWHAEDAPFKAKYIYEIIRRNEITFESIAEIGCGSGAVLKNLWNLMGNNNAIWRGYDISAEAIGIAQQDPHEAIQFKKQDFLESDQFYEVLLIIDVFEHVSDYINFVSRCREKARYKIYHIPLDLHVSSVLRDSLTNARESVGHLHYFSKNTAISTLQDTGHKIIADALTPGAIELFKLHPSLKTAIANVPRMIISQFSPSFSTRLLGGHSLLVLTE